MKWKHEQRKLSELTEWGKNPRKLTEKGIKDLTKSIKKFGLAEPIVINTDGTICGGHGRKKVLESLGVEKVDCYIPERALTGKEFEELNIRLNKNIAGFFDIDKLANEFDFDDLIEWGFDEEELIGSTKEKLSENEIELKPYKKIHILISIDVDKLQNIGEVIDQIRKIDG